MKHPSDILSVFSGRRTSLVALLLSGLALAGSPAQAQDLSATDGTTGAVAQAWTGPDLSGTWAQLLVTVSESRFPVIGTIRSTTTAVLRMEVVQDGDMATIEREVCALAMDSGTSMASTRIPAAFVAAVPRAESSVRLSAVGDSWSLLNWEQVEVVGMNLSNPRRDTLPENAEDPRVIDADGDGNPGLTLEVRGIVGGEVYVAQRTVTELLTTRLSQDYMRGEVLWEAEQITLGASNRLLISDNRAEPAADGSYFEAQRVTTGARCAEIRGEAEALFGVDL
jgi:hypothetical protein